MTGPLWDHRTVERIDAALLEAAATSGSDLDGVNRWA